MAGLAAALEAAQAGAKVTVIDRASVFGGHAVMSAADIAMVNTPLQRAHGIHDSPEIAYKDFMDWGIDANPDWVRYYVDHSATEIYDWLVGLGVKFTGFTPYPGNSVPRAHKTRGLGLGLVRPVYLACLKQRNIVFVWNTEAIRLLSDHGTIGGVVAKNLRTGEIAEFAAATVVLATGGFQSNTALALENWPSDLPKPPVLLAGSGVNSTGSGLTLATEAGAALSRLDHQWNYERGLPDPRYPGMNRGLNAVVQGLRVNASGTTLDGNAQSSDEALRLILNQPGATFWTVFDEKHKRSFWISGSDWAQFGTIQRKILDNPLLVKKAPTLAGLAEMTGLPRGSLEESIARHNEHGDKIDTPPFYAAQFYPMTRKSMGGIVIDSNARVLDRQSRPIRGLYAAGEVTGEAGINGKRALEGTFLGPAILTGRIAARTALADFRIGGQVSITPAKTPGERAGEPLAAAGVSSATCSGCHPLSTLIKMPRDGYWHFERAHEAVLNAHRDCVQCHAGMGVPLTLQHRIDPAALAGKCGICHRSL